LDKDIDSLRVILTALATVGPQAWGSKNNMANIIADDILMIVFREVFIFTPELIFVSL